jgi:hypothetical protein
MAREISSSDDYIDSRDVIKRIEELESDLESQHEDDKEAGLTNVTDFDEWLGDTAENDDHLYQDEARELKALRALAEQCEGYGDWRHGETLIRDSYFQTYAEQFADDIGAIDRNANWPISCIDWKKAAEELQMDYTSVEFDGVTYWMRS